MSKKEAVGFTCPNCHSAKVCVGEICSKCGVAMPLGATSGVRQIHSHHYGLLSDIRDYPSSWDNVVNVFELRRID